MDMPLRTFTLPRLCDAKYCYYLVQRLQRRACFLIKALPHPPRTIAVLAAMPAHSSRSPMWDRMWRTRVGYAFSLRAKYDSMGTGRSWMYLSFSPRQSMSWEEWRRVSQSRWQATIYSASPYDGCISLDAAPATLDVKSTCNCEGSLVNAALGCRMVHSKNVLTVWPDATSNIEKSGPRYVR